MKNLKNFQALLTKEGIEFKKNYSIKHLTTIKVGGICKILVLPKTEAQLKIVLSEVKLNKYKYFIIGKGSNVIASGKVYNGIIIKLCGKFEELNLQEDILTCGAGASLPLAAAVARQNCLAGFEGLAGVPASIGGAIYGNASAYQSEISKHLIEVVILDEELKIQKIPKNNIKFGYRYSQFKNNNAIILLARFKLPKVDAAELEQLYKKNQISRAEKLPKGFSAGSIFKNGKSYYAGEVLEKAGFKNYGTAAAKFSEKHANVIVTNGSASGREVLKLILKAKRAALKKFNIQLEEEVIILR